MGKVKVAAFTVSLDGFGAGLNQSLKNPIGDRGTELHQWMFKTKVFQKMIGNSGGTTDTDNEFAEKSFQNIGAWIMGRNMFSPHRGSWANQDWKGWWGDNPPYHAPVFVLTHHEREPLHMEGGTTFYFVTDGIESALAKAKEAAKEKDVRIVGGVSTIQNFLKAGLIDEMHLAYSPIFLGSGENLLLGVNLPKLGLKLAQKVLTDDAVHIVLEKQN
ncbi:MAG: dihydrofolate reductase family protein [Bdellovibrionaceae bacterium]|nr:dihydrofolate reductase family protein [Pseudobdellovibrionaceae bacterium]